jgi:hypothetical protein
MRMSVPHKEPLEWHVDWLAANGFDQLWSKSGGYEIRRLDKLAGVNIAAVHPGRWVYVATGFELPRCDLVVTYVGCDLGRAKRYCELHRQRQIAGKRRGFRRERQNLRRRIPRGNFQLN